MATYKQMQDQIKQLQAEAERIRKTQQSEALMKIREIMTEYGITLPELNELLETDKSGAVRAPIPPKYRNPSTGETWTGRGKAPKWIGTGNREKFLIK